jgi:thioredoxin-like negative regulator of GroEL
MIVDQNAESVADRLEMIAVALRLRDYNAARDALATFTPAQVEQPAVLRAYLSYALGTNNRPMADGLFDRLAVSVAPDDDMRVAHAMLLRQHPNAQKAAAARKDLEAFAQNPKFALALNRTAFNDALAAKDLPTARRFAALVIAHPAATFGDRLNDATVALLVDRQHFDPVFAQLAPVAAASGPVAAEFVRWLIVQGKAAEAQRWLATLPGAISGTPECQSVRMDLAVAANDWETFGKLLEQGAWGPIPPEVAKLAMATHLIGSRRTALRKEMWSETMTAAGNNLATLRVLLRVATVWRWEDETETLLWSVLRLAPTQTWAHSTLMRIYRQRGDGRKLFEVVTILKNDAPTSRTYRHDWALLSLLVSPTPDWDAAKIAAKEVHLADPANASYAATYAVALTQAGKAEEARGVIEQLSASDREYPRRAPFVAFVYGHCRRAAEFEKYAALATGASLLEEERRLIDRGREAMTRVEARPVSPGVSPATKKAPVKG